MLPSLGRLGRLALMLSLSLGYIGARGHLHAAWAGDDDSARKKPHRHVVADGDDDGDGDSDGDSDSGGDAGGGGGDGDDGEEGEGEVDKDQPPVTAGGLYTIKTYPVRENSRPLTITEGVAQLRLGLGTDLSAKGAFDSFGLNLEGIYGLKDNFELIGGLTDAYNFKQYSFYFGFEGALAYDLLDIRVAANLHQSAISKYGNFCNPPQTPGEQITMDHPACGRSDANVDVLPSGDFDRGDTKFSIDLGFPFRYSIRPEFAIVALQTLVSIDFNSAKRDYVSVVPIDGAMDGQPKFMTVSKGNGAKPDLNPSIGIATNPIPQLSVVLFAQLRIPDFDTSAGAFQIPVTGRVEFSPSQKFDVGLEFTLLNVKPPDPQSPIDNRFLSFFMQARYGK